jgi:Na+/H+ antiporter NhaA
LPRLVWANVDLANYESFWHARFSIRLGDTQVTRDLRTWINSGSMMLFFFVVGLEARREFDLGDLRERRRFALPFAAGLAGMAVPVAIYLAVNTGHASAHGWASRVDRHGACARSVSAARSRRPGSGAGLLADRLRCRRSDGPGGHSVVYSNGLDANHIGAR